MAWLVTSAAGSSDAGHHDPSGQRAHLGGGQEPAVRETDATRDEGMNKGRILKGGWSETKPFGIDGEKIGSVAKKHREYGSTKVA